MITLPKELEMPFVRYGVYPDKIGNSELIRWTTIDPLWEKYHSCLPTVVKKTKEGSPYNYTLNNLLRFIDPDGKAVIGPGAITAAAGALKIAGWTTIGVGALMSVVGQENVGKVFVDAGEQIGKLGGRIMDVFDNTVPISPSSSFQGDALNQTTFVSPDATGVKISDILLSENTGSVYDQPASRDAQGRPQPDPNAQGSHSTLSNRKGEKQGHTFNDKGQLVKEVSPFGDEYGHPKHQRSYDNTDPKNPKRGKDHKEITN